MTIMSFVAISLMSYLSILNLSMVLETRLEVVLSSGC